MIIKVIPDKEKVKSMIKLVEKREEFVSSIDEIKFPTNAAENYYEIIKELAAAIFLLDGFKATGESAHKEIINSLAKYKEFDESEISILDDLRITRNKSSYEGKQVEISYIENKKDKLLSIITKLKGLLNKKLS